jgi:hypothetical protein
MFSKPSFDSIPEQELLALAALGMLMHLLGR